MFRRRLPSRQHAIRSGAHRPRELRFRTLRPRTAAAAVAGLAIGAALLVPRPSATTNAVAPSTWAPVPREVLAPLATGAPAAALAAPFISASRLRFANPEIKATLPSVAPSAPSRPKTSPVPAPSRAAPSRPTGVIHTITTGDNLWTIAQRHSASLDAILRWNGSVNSDRLVTGQRIFVPGGSKMKPSAGQAAAPRPTKTTITKPAAAPRPPTRPTKPVKPAAARPPASQPPGGSHVWPLAIRGAISRGYSKAHPAIDIAAPTGTPVRAVAAGTVTWAGWKDNGGGYVVIIRHQGGMVSYYNHNSKVLVKRGQKVLRGQAIAKVGATGWATGPHLDVRIYMGGTYVNPLRYL